MLPERSTDLLLLATEQQVFAFDLKDVSRVAIGRHESSDVQLSSRTVSNYHAEIVKEEQGQLILRDLGSTNGTYVNGERVDRVAVATGDSILVGHHVLSLQIQSVSGGEGGWIRYARGPEPFGPGTRGRILSINAPAPEAAKTLQASDPNDMTFPDLLRQLALGARSNRAVVERQGERGFVSARRGKIVHALCGAVEGEKALYRLFSWRQASYEIEEAASESESARTIHLPTDALISEGMEHSLEIGGLIARLPPVAVPLRLREDCAIPLTAHSPAEIDVFQEIIRHQTIEKVLSSSPLPDVRILRLVESLLRKGVFQAATFELSHEETFVSRPKAPDR